MLRIVRGGSLEAPVHVEDTAPGRARFMNLDFPDQVATNVLTLDAWDPKSGTAEFKATAIRWTSWTPPTTPRSRAGVRKEGQWIRLGVAAPATARSGLPSPVLGPPESGWDGGECAAADGHPAFGGHAAGHGGTAAAVLHAVQDGSAG